jgi:cytochrome c5
MVSICQRSCIDILDQTALKNNQLPLNKLFIMKIKSFFLITLTGCLFITACSKKTVPVSASPQPIDEKPEVSTAPAFKADPLEGMNVYQSSCGRCHELKATTEYTSSEWHPIMNSMAKKARLTDAQKAHVLAYVTQNAKSAK